MEYKQDSFKSNQIIIANYLFDSLNLDIKKSSFDHLIEKKSPDKILSTYIIAYATGPKRDNRYYAPIGRFSKRDVDVWGLGSPTILALVVSVAQVPPYRKSCPGT